MPSIIHYLCDTCSSGPCRTPATGLANVCAHSDLTCQEWHPEVVHELARDVHVLLRLAVLSTGDKNEVSSLLEDYTRKPSQKLEDDILAIIWDRPASL